MSAAAVAPAPHLPVLLDEVLAGLAVRPAKPMSTAPSVQAAIRAPCSGRGRDE